MSTQKKMPARRLAKFLSIDRSWHFCPEPFLDPDCGLPFDIVPDAPGVIILLDAENEAICIEACEKSMRQRLEDHYKGLEGGPSFEAATIFYEPSSAPAVREAELIAEHKKQFGFVPKRNRA